MPVAAYQFSQLEGSVSTGVTEDVLSAAWAEAEQIRAAAHAEGYAAGLAEGRSAFGADAVPALAALRGAANALDALSAATVAGLSEQAAELALAIAEQVLSGVVAVDPGRVVDVCRGALRRLADRTKVVVLVHPEDMALLSAETAALSAELGGIERFEVQADRRIDRGGVVVRTDQGEIDATITTQLARVRAIVTETVGADPEPVDGEVLDYDDLPVG